jgi:ABC-type antimicrobial peptide transport system permease subunit
MTILENPEKKAVYFPSAGKSANEWSVQLFVRGKGSPDDTRKRLDALLVSSGAVDRGARVYPLAEQLGMQEYAIKLMAVIASLLGGVALILTLSGMYGAASYLLGQRTKEIGIRMAIGATAGDASRFLFGYSMRLTAIGMVVGIALAMAVAKLISGEITMAINVFDWPAYAIGILAVGIAAVAATLGPALGAARVDPASTLRSE